MSRIHGIAAVQVKLCGVVLPQLATEVDMPLAISHAASGWYPDVDVYGPMTVVKLPAGATDNLIVELSGSQSVNKTIEMIHAEDASLSGPNPKTISLRSSNPMYVDADIFGQAPSLHPILVTNHHGYPDRNFVSGFAKVGTAATFYLSRRKAGKYEVSFRIANGELSKVKTINIYINGNRFKTLKIPSQKDWAIWQEIGILLPLVAGNNVITIRHDLGNTGAVNLDSLNVSREPVM